MKIKSLLVVLICLNIGAAHAQNAQQAIKDIWKEKTEWRNKAAEQNGQNLGSSDNEKSLADSNIVISATADVQSEVHAAINPTDSNNIVVSSNFVSTSLASETNYIYYTHNFGQTWQKSTFATSPDQTGTTVLGGGDPNFAFTDQGKVYFSWINLFADQSFNTYFNLYWASSLNGGNTWQRDSTNDLIGSAPSSVFGGGGAFDKEWLASDNNPSSQFYGNLYCSFFYADANTGATSIGVRSKTATSTFTTTNTQVNTGSYKFLQFSSITVDRNGGVHTTFFASVDSVVYSIYQATSTDGGVTFAPEVKISDVSLARYSAGQQNDSIQGIDPSRLYPSPYIACDVSNGHHSNYLYMVWTANGTTSKLNSGNDIYISISSDGGVTWSPARILNDNTTNLKSDQYYPCITVSPAGRVVVMWWDRRDDSLNVKSNIYLTYSDDGGQTFAPDIKVTSLPTNFADIGLKNGGFGIGEYNAVLATADYIIPVWADGRSNNGNINLYSAFIHVSQAQTVDIKNITAINGALKINSLFPNPAQNQLTLSYESAEAGKVELAIYDVTGKLVLPLGSVQVTEGSGTLPLNISKLAAGSYLVKVELNGSMNVREFVKVK